MRFAPTIEKLPDAWAYRSSQVQYQERNWTYLRAVKRSQVSERRAIGTTLAIRLYSLILLTIAAGLIDNATQTSAYGAERLAFTRTIFFGNMINTNSPQWKAYVQHVLKWEGKTSSNQQDSAARCYPGGIHTNKGVTYCTFTKYAESLNITPVSHDRFLKLTDNEVGLFIYRFYKLVDGDKFSKDIALSLTEVAWLSGPSTAIKTLQKALNAMGREVAVDGKLGPKTIGAAKLANQKTLYEEFWKERERWLRALGSSSRYSRWLNGWLNRLNSFTGKFSPGLFSGIIGTAILATGAFFLYKRLRK